MSKLILKNPDLPSYTMTLPVCGMTAKFRPFVVREEKVLLIALQSQEENQITDAIRKILFSCTDGMIETQKLCVADAEYAFLQLRAKSIGEEAKPQVSCNNCGGSNTLKVRLDQFTVNKQAEDQDNKIKIYDDFVLVMRYPSIHDTNTGGNGVEEMFDLAKKCVESVITNEEIHKRDEIDEKELSAFIDNLLPSEFEKIIKFFERTPKLNFDVGYTCPSCKNKVKVRFKSITDFF